MENLYLQIWKLAQAAKPLVKFSVPIFLYLQKWKIYTSKFGNWRKLPSYFCKVFSTNFFDKSLRLVIPEGWVKVLVHLKKI